MKQYLNGIYSDTKEKLYLELDKVLKNKEKRFIVTVNPETMEISKTNDNIKKMLEDKNVLKVPDGVAIVKACNYLNIPVKERITGVDIASELLHIANKNKYSMYLFGAKEEVIEELVRMIKKEYKNIKLVGYSNGYVSNRDKVMKEIVKLKPDVCMIALGIPYQEELIYKYQDKFKKGIFIGVGGSFDVLSGVKKRAPKLFIKLNLEWLYRIIKEPKRIKRFLKYNVKFMFDIKRQK